MKKQRGAALVVVLSMLAMSLMLGLSGMQSSLIEERLAGNYKAAADAQMAAERAASSGWEYIISESFDEGWVSLSDLSVPDLESLTWEGVKSGRDGGCAPPLSCYYIYVEDGVDNYIVAMGAVNDGDVSVSMPVIVGVSIGRGGSRFSATNILGGLASDGELQFPSSRQSGIHGGDFDHEGKDQEVGAFSMYSRFGNDESETIYSKDQLVSMGGKAALDENNVEVNDFSNYEVFQEMMSSVSFLRSLYVKHLENGGNVVSGNGGSATCNGLCFYEDGMKVTGNQTIEGVHVVLNGDAQIGGNADLQGVLVVLNLDIPKEDKGKNKGGFKISPLEVEEWGLVPVSKLKLNGGGHKGTVWFDEGSVRAALDTVGVSLVDFFMGDNGSSGGAKSIISWQ